MVGRLEAWEQERVARTLSQVNEEVVKREENGEEVRPEIADPDSEGAKTVFESVVDAAAHSIEERKCEVIANLYTSIAFDASVSISNALLYVKRVREASWRQIVALRYFEDPDRRQERDQIGVAGEEGDVRIHPVLSVELAEAARSLELIGLVQQDGSVANPANTLGGGQITSGSVLHLGPTGLGATVSRLGRLSDVVTTAELDEIASALRAG
ncbi:MAG TPA: hypothetical protein VLK37_13115 [Solirubrobacterales bacterium]|nr:hypothetical protein [Solirubrobacterales bacterium]